MTDRWHGWKLLTAWAVLVWLAVSMWMGIWQQATWVLEKLGG